MPTCFIIQPFKDPFDSRYEETFKPAIEAAGVTPYRVDQDPDVDVPIESIEKGIREADFAFADITEDNPNVWYELGYAYAAGKGVVLVCCQDERKGRFPFDVLNKAIIQYQTGSAGQWDKLSQGISARLKALVKRDFESKAVARAPLREENGLPTIAQSAMGAVLYLCPAPGATTTESQIVEQMEQYGYSREGAAVALRILSVEGMLTFSFEESEYGDPYRTVALSEKGDVWAIKNVHLFKVRRWDEGSKSSSADSPPNTDQPYSEDDIQF